MPRRTRGTPVETRLQIRHIGPRRLPQRQPEHPGQFRPPAIVHIHADGDDMTPLAAKAALDAYFLEARAKLLDLAGILDRIGRGTGASTLEADSRMTKVRQAFEILQDRS